jgi:hypothetical protein
MKRTSDNPLLIDHCNDYGNACDLDALLHPAQAFEHPSDVVNDPDLTVNEKRAILASWASDACAMEAAPALRCTPGRKEFVRFDDVMDALRALDREARKHDSHRAPPKHPSRKKRYPDDGQGQPLN